MESKSFQFEPIGILRTPFKEKFGIPRQSGMILAAEGVIELLPNPHFVQAVKGLEQFSHLWLIFVFHAHGANHWKPSIRPPRLGGAKRVGVLASRSPHRPNPIGLSTVELLKVTYVKKRVRIHVRGVDILDQTPILDIKPYLPYADLVPHASSGWAEEPIERVPVQFSDEALEKIILLERLGGYGEPGHFKKLIHQMIELDPRPGSQRKKQPWGEKESLNLQYGIWILDQDVKWTITKSGFLVQRLETGPEFRKTDLESLNLSGHLPVSKRALKKKAAKL